MDAILLTNLQIEHGINNQKNDLPRKNTEVYVEDFNISVINRSHENAWDQEDDMMNTKDLTELLLDERLANNINDDIPRIEDVEEVKNLNDGNAAVSRNRNNEQENAVIGMREHAEAMRTDIEIENMNNDIPRQNMELEVERREVEISDRNRDYANDQYNSNINTKNTVTDLQIRNEDNIKMYNDRRVKYEDVVSEFSEELILRKNNLDDRTEDESYSTVDHIETMVDNKTAFAKAADDKAVKNQENTIDAVESILDEKADVSKDTEEHLANNVDYIESLKDINPNEVDEKMKNQLGLEFPEGVTEEIYTNKDEDSYVVRRIVVRKGVGNFYEKVRTRFGSTTYTMNGKGISEYQWQDQTEASDLVRN